MNKRTIQGLKFLQEDLTSRNDLTKTKWVIGQWRKHDGPLEMCWAGFHASNDPYDSLRYVYGPRWFKIEAKGKIIEDSDKFVASEMRLVTELPTKLIAVRFAVACARHVLDKFESQYPNDDRPRKAVEAAEAWLKKPSEHTQSAAWSAASAAESAAESGASAARSAARSAVSAAWSAAWSARSAASAAESAARSAESAAWSAAWSTEIRWQRKTLNKIIQDESQ